MRSDQQICRIFCLIFTSRINDSIAVKTFGIADVQLPILLSRKTEGLEIKTARITGLSNRADSRRAATDKMKASRAEEHGFLPKNRSARGPMAQVCIVAGRDYI